MIALGLTAPLATQMLAYSGVAVAAETIATSRPRQAVVDRLRCCGGKAPTLLNPHFAVGTKDQDASRSLL